jgi:hypothetical protein
MLSSTSSVPAGCLLVVALSSTVSAEDGAVRVYESTFTKLATAVQPLRLSRSFSISVPVPNPLIPGLIHWVSHSCAAVADVTGLTFDITAAGVAVRGSVSASVCDVSFSGTLNTFATMTYNSSTRSLRVTTGSTSVRPSVTAFGQTVFAPFSINVGPSLSFPPIPVDTASFVVETPGALRTFRLTGRNVQLSRQNGFIELRGDVQLW